jgi:hypothetical protein
MVNLSEPDRITVGSRSGSSATRKRDISNLILNIKFVTADPTHIYQRGSSYGYDLANNLNGGGGGWTYNSDNQLTSAPAVGDLPGVSNLTGQQSTTSFEDHAADGWYTDTEMPDIVSVDSRPYIPNVGQMGAPGWPGGMGGGTPYSVAGNNPVAGGGYGGFGSSDDEDPDAFVGLPHDWNGANLPYRPFLKATNVGAGILKQVLLFAAGFNPIEQAREVVQGNDPVGHKLSAGQRTLMLAMMVGPHGELPSPGLLDGISPRTPIALAGYDVPSFGTHTFEMVILLWQV